MTSPAGTSTSQRCDNRCSIRPTTMRERRAQRDDDPSEQPSLGCEQQRGDHSQATEHEDPRGNGDGAHPDGEP